MRLSRHYEVCICFVRGFHFAPPTVTCTQARLSFVVFCVTFPPEIYLFIFLFKMNSSFTSGDCGVGCLRTNWKCWKTTQCRFMGTGIWRKRNPEFITFTMVAFAHLRTINERMRNRKALLMGSWSWVKIRVQLYPGERGPLKHSGISTVCIGETVNPQNTATQSSSHYGNPQLMFTQHTCCSLIVSTAFFIFRLRCYVGFHLIF